MLSLRLNKSNTMQTAINSTLAARFSLHSDDQLTLADSVADAVDRRVRCQWNKIFFALKSKKTQAEKKIIIRAALYDLWIDSHQELKKGFQKIADNSFIASKKILGEVIPIGHLNLQTTVKRLTEATKASIKKKMADAIFKPLSPEKVEQIVKGTTAGMSWQGRLAQQSNLASPEQLATLVTSGFNAGATPAQLAALIKPQVAGVAASARRIARNESMRIAHETRMEAYEDLGEMVSGYQIHATMDSRVRPEHAARSGTVYSKKPKGNERPMSEMPRPPLEADGTVAHNCRCWITPVLEIQTHIEEDPAAKAVFTDAAGRLIPNPAVYTQWFDKANQTDKEKVVGVKRLKLMKELVPIGQSIQWGHFINPETGKLLGFEELRVESEIQRKERVGKFDAVIAKRLELTKQVYTYGYIPPEPPPKVAAITPPEPKPITPPAVDPKLGVVPINPIAEPKVTAVAIPADSVVVPANPVVITPVTSTAMPAVAAVAAVAALAIKTLLGIISPAQKIPIAKTPSKVRKTKTGKLPQRGKKKSKKKIKKKSKKKIKKKKNK